MRFKIKDEDQQLLGENFIEKPVNNTNESFIESLKDSTA